VRAQQPRRVGVLISLYTQNDREGQARVAAFLDTFQRLGWTDGSNIAEAAVIPSAQRPRRKTKTKRSFYQMEKFKWPSISR
jgi:hypothetical protein